MNQTAQIFRVFFCLNVPINCSVLLGVRRNEALCTLSGGTLYGFVTLFDTDWMKFVKFMPFLRQDDQNKM